MTDCDVIVIVPDSGVTLVNYSAEKGLHVKILEASDSITQDFDA